MSFEAAYYGNCLACDERIVPGDDITYDDGDLVHAECASFDDDDE